MVLLTSLFTLFLYLNAFSSLQSKQWHQVVLIFVCTSPFISALLAHYVSLIIVAKLQSLKTKRSLNIEAPVVELSGHVSSGDRSFAQVYV